MKCFSGTLLLTIGTLAVVGITGCGPNRTAPVRHDITAAQLQAMMADGQPILLIDVRTSTEFAGGRIPGAVNHPLDAIETWSASLDATARTVLICKGGVRSKQAADTLVQKSFASIYNLLGGMDGWTGDVTTG